MRLIFPSLIHFPVQYKCCFLLVCLNFPITQNMNMPEAFKFNMTAVICLLCFYTFDFVLDIG